MFDGSIVCLLMVLREHQAHVADQLIYMNYVLCTAVFIESWILQLSPCSINVMLHP